MNSTVATNGIFSFTIQPSPSDDYDFAVWVFPSGTPIPCPPNIPPVRCSWAATSGPTGLNNGSVDVSEDAFGNGWVSNLNVTAGQQLLILIDNFSATNTPFTMDFNGTASLASGGVISGTTTLCAGLTSQLAGPGVLQQQTLGKVQIPLLLLFQTQVC